MSIPTIKPLNSNYLQEHIINDTPLFTLEEHSIIGGLGSAISEIIAESGRGLIFKRFGILDVFTHEVGDHEFHRAKYIQDAKETIAYLLNEGLN